MKKFFLLIWMAGSVQILNSTNATPAHAAEQRNLKAEAVAAFKAGNNKAASELALQLLKEKAPQDKPIEKRDGDAVHDANQILGLVALREKRVKDAKLFLIAAGSSPGSTNLEMFGPNMKLAQELLEQGEKGIVIAYLNLVSKFWGNVPEAHRKELEKKNPDLLENIDYVNKQSLKYLKQWIALIREGEKPILNHSSDY